MKRKQLKSKEVNIELGEFGISFSKKDQVELLEDENNKLLAVNKKILFFYYNNKLVPTLKLLQEKPTLLKQITVDMGAIKFVINGADIMRPGIVDIEENVNKDDFVVIVDERNKKPLAVGIALFNGEEMKTGKVIKNIHYIGDEIWRMG